MFNSICFCFLTFFRRFHKCTDKEKSKSASGPNRSGIGTQSKNLIIIVVRLQLSRRIRLFSTSDWLQPLLRLRFRWCLARKLHRWLDVQSRVADMWLAQKRRLWIARSFRASFSTSTWSDTSRSRVKSDTILIVANGTSFRTIGTVRPIRSISTSSHSANSNPSTTTRSAKNCTKSRHHITWPTEVLTRRNSQSNLKNNFSSVFWVLMSVYVHLAIVCWSSWHTAHRRGRIWQTTACLPRSAKHSDASSARSRWYHSSTICQRHPNTTERRII